jgi:choline dehydrogenase
VESFDYIIVGAGPAGCVLANRLSRDSSKRVLLLEAGPEDRHPLIHMPKGIGRILADSRYTWAHPAQQGPTAEAVDAFWLRGKTLGGSSSVNGLIYVRGQPQDYEDLAAVTSEDWNWQQMLRCFRAIEDHELGATDYRGSDGPLHVTVSNDQDKVTEAALAAGRTFGLDRQEDINRPDDVDKIGYSTRTIYRGRRQSASVAFLDPIRARKNLSIRTSFTVDRILFEDFKAVAVIGEVQGRPEQLRATKIIVCGGTLSTPAIFQRSGIGPGGLLRRLDVPVLRECSEVGENLQEHYSLIMQWRLKHAVSQNPQFGGWRLYRNTLRYFLFRSGPMANATFEALAFLRSKFDKKRPDLQFLIAPYTIDFKAKAMAVEDSHGMQIGGYPLRPASKGTLHITSRSPSTPPRIAIDFFAQESDRQAMLGVVRMARKLCETEPLASMIEGEVRPGKEIQNEADILEAYRANGTIAYHAVGTCRMGKDTESVVDPKTRVRGVDNLYVVDLSILPFVVAGNTFGPLCAIAWRAAELIGEDN